MIRNIKIPKIFQNLKLLSVLYHVTWLNLKLIKKSVQTFWMLLVSDLLVLISYIFSDIKNDFT